MNVHRTSYIRLIYILRMSHKCSMNAWWAFCNVLTNIYKTYYIFLQIPHNQIFNFSQTSYKYFQNFWTVLQLPLSPFTSYGHLTATMQTFIVQAPETRKKLTKNKLFKNFLSKRIKTKSWTDRFDSHSLNVILWARSTNLFTAVINSVQ